MLRPLTGPILPPKCVQNAPQEGIFFKRQQLLKNRKIMSEVANCRGMNGLQCASIRTILKIVIAS